MSLRHLVGKERILALETELKGADRIMEMSEDWSRLADALYLADEKNVTEEREKLFDRIESYEMEEIRIHMRLFLEQRKQLKLARRIPR